LAAGEGVVGVGGAEACPPASRETRAHFATNPSMSETP